MMLRNLLILLAVFLAYPIHAQYKNIYRKSAWEERDKWQQPERIIAATGIGVGGIIADIGCHEGYMTVKFAARVGENGKVYAVDVNNYRLDRLRDYLEDQEILNVEVIKGDYDNPKLPADILDVVFILDTYHEMDEYKSMLGHIRKSLKPGGKLVIIEPIATDRESWSRSRQTGRHEIAIRYVEEELKESGFRISQREKTFLDRKEEKGDKLWLLVAVKN